MPVLQDFNSKQTKFKFSLGSGSTKVLLRDLELDPGYLQTLMPGLPFEVAKSTVDYIQITVSIAQINTEPMEVQIGNLFLEVREPVKIMPYTGQKDGISDSVGQGKSGHRRTQSGDYTETKEGPGGLFVKAKKKNYTTAQKVWHGTSWNIKRVQVLVHTLGEDKSEDVEEELRPPSLEILLEDIFFHITNERWKKCNLKEARAFSEDLAESTYLFKEGR